MEFVVKVLEVKNCKGKINVELQNTGKISTYYANKSAKVMSQLLKQKLVDDGKSEEETK